MPVRTRRRLWVTPRKPADRRADGHHRRFRGSGAPIQSRPGGSRQRGARGWPSRSLCTPSCSTKPGSTDSRGSPRARGISRVWITPVRHPARRRRAGGDRRRGHGGDWARQPVHEPVAATARSRHRQTRLVATRAPRIFVCNVATQVGETEGYTLSQHLAALQAPGSAMSSTQCS